MPPSASKQVSGASPANLVPADSPFFPAYFILWTRNDGVTRLDLSDPCSDPLSFVQKRLAEKAAKQAARANVGGSGGGSETPTATGSGSAYGDSASATPMTNRSAAGSQEDLMSMEKLRLATERYAPHPSLSMRQTVQNGLLAICAMSFTMMRESQTSGATSNHYFLSDCVHLLEVLVLSMVHLTTGTPPAEHPAKHRIRFRHYICNVPASHC